MKYELLPFENLFKTIQKLRGPQGCPWDKKQTPASLQKYLREEVEELLQAIDKNDTENIREEIGDVLYILIMLAEIHAEDHLFTFNDSIVEIDTKLIRRHPHVFEGKEIHSDEELRLQWEKIKKEEKQRNI
jgi:MazG family protein